MLEDGSSEPLPGGIRLRYVPAEPLSEGDLAEANLTAAVQYMRNRGVPAGSITVQLYSNLPPSQNSSGNVSGSGYTRGGQASVPASAQVRPVLMNQPPPPHPAGCQCATCMPIPVHPGLNCTCPSCTAYRQQYSLSSPFAPGGLVPSPPAATASQPPSYRPQKPKTGWGARGMDGFDGAPLVAGTALGYRWWTLRAPPLHLNPASVSQDWNAGLLRGVKDVWEPGVNLARCLPALSGYEPHPFELIPYSDCGCGYWSYWEIQPHDTGMVSSLPVVGVIRASGQVIMGPRGFRAQKAEIVALHLPFRIQPDLPAARRPAEDTVTRALRGRPGRVPAAPWMTHPRFTGKVINVGTGYVPAPLQPPPEPEPPTDEEIRAAADAAEAWMALIADRLMTTYPGTEVCATLDLMKAKYPVRSEYAPPREQVTFCPYCGEAGEAENIHRHLAEKHRF